MEAAAIALNLPVSEVTAAFDNVGLRCPHEFRHTDIQRCFINQPRYAARSSACLCQIAGLMMMISLVISLSNLLRE